MKQKKNRCGVYNIFIVCFLYRSQYIASSQQSLLYTL